MSAEKEYKIPIVDLKAVSIGRFMDAICPYLLCNDSRCSDCVFFSDVGKYTGAI